MILLSCFLLDTSNITLGKILESKELNVEFIDEANPIAFDKTNCKKLGEYDKNYGDSYDIFIEKRGFRTYGYVADGIAGLLVLDMTRSNQPKFIGSYSNISNANSVCVKDGIAYVTQWYGKLTILDVSNPSNPKKLGEFKDTENPWKVGFFRNNLVIADGYVGLLIIDISDPKNPQLLNSYMVDDWGIYDFHFQDETAFVVGRRFEILNLSDLDNITPISVFETFDYSLSFGLHIYENTAMIFSGDDILQIIDISVLTQPYELFLYCDLSEYFVDGYVIDDCLYVLTRYNGLLMINYTNPSDISKIGEFFLPGYYCNAYFSDKFFYLADRNSGIKIIEVGATPSDLQFIGYFSDGGITFDVSIDKSIAYVANGNNGLLILDVKNPYNPKLLSNSFSGNTDYQNIVVQNDFAYLVNKYSLTLDVFDVSNPVNPIKLTPDINKGYSINSPTNLVIENNRAYIFSAFYSGYGDKFSYLEIYNITDVNNITSLGKHYFEDEYSHVFVVQNEIAYLGLRSGMHIFDVSNSSSLREISVYSPESYYYFGDITINENLVYCAMRDFGLRIVDISDLASPFEVGSYQTHNSIDYNLKGGINIQYENGFVYMADIDDGLLAFDVSSPANPLLQGFYYEITNMDAIRDENFGINLLNIAIYDNIVYLAAEIDGLILIHFNAAPISQGIIRRNVILSVSILTPITLVAIPVIGIRVRKRRLRNRINVN